MTAERTKIDRGAKTTPTKRTGRLDENNDLAMTAIATIDPRDGETTRTDHPKGNATKSLLLHLRSHNSNNNHGAGLFHRFVCAW